MENHSIWLLITNLQKYAKFNESMCLIKLSFNLAHKLLYTNIII